MLRGIRSDEYILIDKSGETKDEDVGGARARCINRCRQRSAVLPAGRRNVAVTIVMGQTALLQDPAQSVQITDMSRLKRLIDVTYHFYFFFLQTVHSPHIYSAAR